VTPMIISIWWITLGLMGIFLIYFWLSSSSMAMGYLHAQTEIYYLLFRSWILWGSNSMSFRISAIALGTFSGATFITFMTTSNAVIQALIASTAFATDLALLILTPIYFCQALAQHKHLKLNPTALHSEYFLATIAFFHYLIYNGQLVFVFISVQEEYIYYSGLWLTVGLWIVLPLFMLYAYFCIRVVQDYIRDNPQVSITINNQDMGNFPLAELSVMHSGHDSKLDSSADSLAISSVKFIPSSPSNAQKQLDA